MYRYEYVTVSYDFGGWGPLLGNSYSSDGYREVINKRAANGWRFVAAIPSKQRNSGHIQEMDLVFEKEV